MAKNGIANSTVAYHYKSNDILHSQLLRFDEKNIVTQTLAQKVIQFPAILKGQLFEKQTETVTLLKICFKNFQRLDHISLKSIIDNLNLFT